MKQMRMQKDNLTDLEVLPMEIRSLFREPTIVIDEIRWYLIQLDDIMGNGNSMVVFSMCGGYVDDAGTIRICNKFVHKHPKCPVAVLQLD